MGEGLKACVCDAFVLLCARVCVCVCELICVRVFARLWEEGEKRRMEQNYIHQLRAVVNNDCCRQRRGGQREATARFLEVKDLRKAKGQGQGSES